MPLVIDLVDRTLFQCEPPRRLPFLFIPNLLGEYLLERPLSAYLDPIMVGICVAAIAMALLQVNGLLWLVLILIFTLRLLLAAWTIGRAVYDDRALLKYGKVLHAHILGMRPHRDLNGEINGAYLDCAIPVGQRRTSVGSVWLPDPAEAARLAQHGRVPVICLARVPGTWRLLDYKYQGVRYEPVREN